MIAVIAVCLIQIGCITPALGDDVAAELLRSRDLVLVGNQWRLSEAVDFRKRLESLDAAIARARNARDEVDKLIRQNESLRKQIEQSETRLQQLGRQSALTTDTALNGRLVALQDRLGQLRRRYLPPQRFSGHPSVRAAILELNAAQERLASDSVRIPRQLERLTAESVKLRDDPQVQRALAVLGAAHRLAQATLSARDQQRLDRAGKIGSPDAVPLYSEAGQMRVPVTVGHTTRTTLSYQPGSGPGYLPHSLIRKWGNSIPASAPERQYRSEDGRVFSVRIVIVDYLRLGSHVLEDVPFYALPPEGEDLGGRFTDSSLGRYKVRADLAHLKLIVGR